MHAIIYNLWLKVSHDLLTFMCVGNGHILKDLLRLMDRIPYNNKETDSLECALAQHISSRRCPRHIVPLVCKLY